MKKKSLMLLPLICLSTLVGCSGGSGSNSKEIVFWHCIGHTKMRNLEKIINQFNEDHANTDGYYITAEQLAGAYDDLHDAVKTKINAGKMPSITMGYPDSFSEYIGKSGEANSKILKLDSYINSDSSFNTSDMVEMYYKEGQGYQYSGTWSVPLYKSTEVMYYNIEMFQSTEWYKTNKDKTETKTGVDGSSYTVKYGDPSTWDWDTLMTAGKSIKNESQYKNMADFYSIGYDSDANLFISQMAQRGISYTDVSNEDNKFTFYDADKQQSAEGLDNLVQEIYDLNKAGVLTTAATYGTYSSGLFLSNKVIFTIGSTGGSAYNDPVEYSKDFTAGLCQAPSYRNNKKYIMQGPSLCFFNLGDTAKEAATWEFYSKYLSDPTLNAELSLENSYDPVRKSSYQTNSYQTWCLQGKTDSGEDDVTKEFKYRIPNLTATMTDYYMTSDVFIGSSEARTQIGSLLKYMQDGSTASQAVRTAFENCVNASL